MLQHIIRFLAPAGLGEAPTLASRVAKPLGAVGAKFAMWGRYNRALRELSSLDQRDLDDLAIGRGDLPALALRHATGGAPVVRLYH